MVAALGLYALMCGGEGAAVIVAAVDERQAGIVFNIAVRMVELCDELSSRIQIFKDRLVVPSRGATFTCLPASPASLEGQDYTLAIADEIGRIDRDVWEIRLSRMVSVSIQLSSVWVHQDRNRTLC